MSADEQTWTTRAGNTIPVSQMDPAHAAAVVAKIERTAMSALEAAADRAGKVRDLSFYNVVSYDFWSTEASRLSHLLADARQNPDVAQDWIWEERGPLLLALSARAKEQD